MRARFNCSRCLKGSPFDPQKDRSVTCAGCGEGREVQPTPLFREKGRLDQCLLCQCGHLYIEKDFPAWLGGGIIVAGIIAFLILTFVHIVYALGVLLGVAFLDYVVYQLTSFRTICYRCLATYQGSARNPEHKPHDLGIAARFADDYEDRKEELKL